MRRTKWWLKIGLFALFLILILGPFTLKMAPELIQHLIFKHRSKCKKISVKQKVQVNPSALWKRYKSLIYKLKRPSLLSSLFVVRVPFFADLNQPADFSLNHTINMYLTSETGISLGVW